MAMHIDLGPEAERFRDELRQWLEANRPAGLDDEDERIAMMRNPTGLRDWTDRLHRAGYLCVARPEESGNGK